MDGDDMRTCLRLPYLQGESTISFSICVDWLNTGENTAAPSRLRVQDPE